MRAVDASGLLDVWDAGRGESPQRWALLLLAAARPEGGPGPSSPLTIGERDARLLELRERAFGPELECVVTCPGCGERLELRGTISDLLPRCPAEAAEPPPVEVDGYAVTFRLPRTDDLLELEGCADTETCRRLLLRRCLTELRRQGETVEADDLPGSVVSVVEAAMQRADPAAWIRLDLDCPACGHGWKSTFDVVSYLRTEIDAWARRALGQVHALASAYGWTEGEILGMSARRRAAYMNLIST